MSICVFQQYCLEPDPYLEKYFNQDKKPFPMVQPSEWSELEQKFDQAIPSNQPSWSMESIVNVPQNCEIMNPLTEEEGATALVLLCQGSEKARIQINDDHDWIVMMLDAMGRHTSEPKDIQFWAQKTGIDPNELVGVVNNLVQGGFLERV